MLPQQKGKKIKFLKRLINVFKTGRLSGNILRSKYLVRYRNVKYIYRGAAYRNVAERGCTSRSIFDPAGLWLSSKAIAAYRFVVRFEFSRVIWRAWGMHRLPSDQSICSSSSSSPAARPRLWQPACLSAEKICIYPYSSDDTRTRHTWKTVARVTLEFPMGNLECRSSAIFDRRDNSALNSTGYFDIDDSLKVTQVVQPQWRHFNWNDEDVRDNLKKRSKWRI